MQHIKSIQICPLFFELLPEEIAQITQDCTILNYSSGEIINFSDREKSSLFIIMSGHAQIEKRLGEHNHNLQPLSPGDFFGEYLLFENHQYDFQIKVLTQFELMEIPFAHLQRIFHEAPQTYALLFTNLTREILKKNYVANLILHRLLREGTPTLRTPLYNVQNRERWVEEDPRKLKKTNAA